MTIKKNLVSLVLMSIATIATMMFTACSEEDMPESTTSNVHKAAQAPASGAQTVLIYLAGRNDLSGALMKDLNEVKEGSKRLHEHNQLVVFVRNNNDSQPWVARIRNGQVTDSVSLSDLGIKSSDGQNRASDPAVMEGVMRYAFSHYPAANGNYGLVIEGHGSGWLMKNEVYRDGTRAVAADYGNSEDSRDARWINIPTMASILKGLPRMKFIMTDCCNMMCLENLYELRNVCDYMIGSPAEIPADGAPYDQIVADLFSQSDKFYTGIISKYYNSAGGHLPLVAVKTSEMENVAQATRTALQAVGQKTGSYPDMTGIIHYYHTDSNYDKFRAEYNIFYDAGDFFSRYAPADVYRQWRQALNRAVVELRTSTKWATDKLWSKKYADFKATAEKMHGVSMFVPQNPAKGNYAKYNEDIKKMAWYGAVN